MQVKKIWIPSGIPEGGTKLNTANKLTMLRFGLAVLFIVLFYVNHMYAQIAAFFVFAAASFTDFLDGHIARKYNQITKLGKLTDPLADKILVFSALILLVEKGYIYGWLVIVILSRDLMMSIFRAVAAAHNIVIAADILGKIKTVFQMISILMILFGKAFKVDLIFRAGYALLLLAVVLTILSGVNYIYKNRRVLEE